VPLAPLASLHNCRSTSFHPEESLRKGMSESFVSPVTSMRINRKVRGRLDEWKIMMAIGSTSSNPQSRIRRCTAPGRKLGQLGYRRRHGLFNNAPSVVKALKTCERETEPPSKFRICRVGAQADTIWCPSRLKTQTKR